MHAASASPRATAVTAKKLGDKFHRGHALCQCVAVSAMRTENHVVYTQVSTHPHGDGFLPDVGVASTMDQAALMAARQLFLTLSY
jgi:hypothetical protein